MTDEGGTPAEQIGNYGPGKNPNISDETINKGYGKKEDILLEEVVNAIPKVKPDSPDKLNILDSESLHMLPKEFNEKIAHEGARFDISTNLLTDPSEYLEDASKYQVLPSGEIFFIPPAGPEKVEDTKAQMRGEAMRELKIQEQSQYMPLSTGESLRKIMTMGPKFNTNTYDDEEFLKLYGIKAEEKEEESMTSQYFLEKFANFAEWKTGELSFIEKLERNFDSRNDLISSMENPTRRLGRDMDQWRKSAMDFNDKTMDLHIALCRFAVPSDDVDRSFQSKIKTFPIICQTVKQQNEQIQKTMNEIKDSHKQLTECGRVLTGIQTSWKAKYKPFRDNLNRIQKIREDYIKQKKEFGKISFVEKKLEHHLKNTIERQLDFQSIQIEYAKSSTNVSALYYQLQQFVKTVLLKQRDTLEAVALYLSQSSEGMI